MKLRKLMVVPVAVSAIALGACGSARQDASHSGQTVDKSGAEVIAFPDAFRNVADKCDHHGHRVYSNSTGGSGKSSQLFVINDPSCR